MYVSICDAVETYTIVLGMEIFNKTVDSGRVYICMCMYVWGLSMHHLNIALNAIRVYVCMNMCVCMMLSRPMLPPS